jgi:hypothetical protein
LHRLLKLFKLPLALWARRKMLLEDLLFRGRQFLFPKGGKPISNLFAIHSPPPFSNSLLNKSFFAGCSKMPGCKSSSAKSPLPGAPKILRVASRRIRSDILPRRGVGESARGVLRVRRNKPAPCLTRGRLRGIP